MFLIAALAAAALSFPAAEAACLPARAEACVLTLQGAQAPRASAACLKDEWKRHLAFGLPEKAADSNGDGWWESTMRLDLDPAKGCSCAVFRVTFGEEPEGFSVNIGDSPTNDGGGGDAGTTRFAAEVELLDSTLRALSIGPPLGSPPDIEPLLKLRLPPLAGRVLELEVCDEQFRFSLTGGPKSAPPLEGEVRTPSTRRLFRIASRPADGEPAGYETPDSLIYAAFNRVIRELEGAPAKRRAGTGVRRVEVLLTP